MAVDALQPARVFLEITSNRAFTLKVNHTLRTTRHEYLRCFIECHLRSGDILAAAKQFASKHHGAAQSVNQSAQTTPLVTISLPIRADASLGEIATLVEKLLEHVELATRTS
jgi:hypothetical protein